MTEPKKFSFSFIGGDNLSKEDIWPDGDEPENPTLADVVKFLKDNYRRNASGLIDDWSFDETMELIVLDVETKEVEHNVLD